MRIAVVSDVHSNLVALDAVLAHAGPVDGVWHLGDVVGYGPDPDGVVARLAEVGAVGVRGNHDAAAVGGDEIEQFNPEARAADGVDARRDLGTDPDVAGGPAGAPGRGRRDPRPRQPARPDLGVPDVAGRARAPRSATSRRRTASTVTPTSRSPSCCGTTASRRSRPAPGDTLELGGRRAIANPGSVGQPRDGDPRASYLILDPEAADRDLAPRRLRHRGGPGRHDGRRPAARLAAG